jgi:thiamine pyrophosphokinase
MRRCVIIGGADIGRYRRIRAHLQRDDFYICCDSGLKHREGLGIAPDLIVGDFDSHANPHLPVETMVLPREKDDTDTVFAAKEALARGFRQFLLLGVTGGRLDHTLGNLSLLLMLHARGVPAVALDDYSEMQIVADKPVLVEDRYPFFSLLNISGLARGVTIRNAKYPLLNAEITCEYQYGISNEVLPGQTAEVSVREGRLLLIKVLPEYD